MLRTEIRGENGTQESQSGCSFNMGEPRGSVRRAIPCAQARHIDRTTSPPEGAHSVAGCERVQPLASNRKATSRAGDESTRALQLALWVSLEMATTGQRSVRVTLGGETRVFVSKAHGTHFRFFATSAKEVKSREPRVKKYV